MTRRSVLALGAFAVAALALWWILFVAVPRWFGNAPAPGSTAGTAAPGGPAAAQRQITATLFYVSEDGLALVPLRREVPFAEPVVEQARQVVEAQIRPPDPPLASAIPTGTTLRAIYMSEAGDVFVDLSGAVTSGHTGGSLDELFTVYTLVNALTVTLPSVARVQILVDGREVDTLAGHVDLRNPLPKNLTWVRSDTP